MAKRETDEEKYARLCYEYECISRAETACIDDMLEAEKNPVCVVLTKARLRLQLILARDFPGRGH